MNNEWRSSPCPPEDLQLSLIKLFPVESPAPKLKVIKESLPGSTVRVYQTGFLIEHGTQRVHMGLSNGRKIVWGYTVM